MGKVKKGKRKKAIQAKGVVFATLVHDEKATVVVQGGVVMLQVNGKPYRLPDGLSLPPEAHGESCTVTIRSITDEVILELGENDVYEDELDDKGYEDVMPVDQWNEVLTLMDETKLKKITAAGAAVGTFISAAILAGVSLYLRLKTDFRPTWALDLGLVAGVVIGVFFGLVKAIPMFTCADCKVLADKEGNYINLDTGRTNLNGGMRLPL